MKNYKVTFSNKATLVLGGLSYSDIEQQLLNLTGLKDVKSIELITDFHIVRDLQKLMDEWSNWTNSTFYKDNKADKTKLICKKLTEEVKELASSIDNLINNPLSDEKYKAVMMEISDAFGLLIDLASKLKISAEDLINSTDAKLQINLGRDWTKQADGTYKHK